MTFSTPLIPKLLFVFCLFAYLSVCLSAILPVRLSVRLSVRLLVHPACPPARLFACLPDAYLPNRRLLTCLSPGPPACPPARFLSIFPPVRLTVCSAAACSPTLLPIRLSSCLSACPPTYLLAGLPVCPPACLAPCPPGVCVSNRSKG
jgi:hypothetical protein